MMLEGAGFEVIDLGINNPVEKYLDALEKHKPDFLGMSALLTTTMPYMKVVIDTLKEKNLRDKYIVLVGGAPLNEEFGKAVGADAYCRDAAIAVETAKRLLAARRAAAGRIDGAPWTRRRESSSSPAARSRARSRRCARANGWTALDVDCLPAELHNRPERIAGAVRETDPRAPRATTRRSSSPTATAARGGALDAVLREEGVERIAGAHCYEFFADARGFAALAEAEPGTFYLTDFLLRHFDRLVIRGLGIDRHPELQRDVLRQLPPARLSGAGAEARRRGRRRRRSPRASGSNIDHRVTGYGGLGASLAGFAERPQVRRMASLTLISWRDIPAQVVVKRGRETAKVKLSDALPGSHRPRRDARRQGQLGCSTSPSGGARPRRPAATTSSTKPPPKRRASRPATATKTSSAWSARRATAPTAGPP